MVRLAEAIDNVRARRPDDLPGIGRYLESSRSACFYHQVKWAEVIERSFGHRCHYLLSERDGRVSGVLPLVHMRSRLFGNMVVSLPFVNYGGVCAEDEDSRNGLIREAVRIAESAEAGYLELRQEEPLDNGMAVTSFKVSMRLDLPADPEILWSSFPSKLRSQVKVPRKAGMSVRLGGVEELGAFYHVFSVNMRRLGTPVLSSDFFRNFLEIFPGSARICTVYTEDGLPAASGFLAGFKETLEIPWASSLREYNRMSPNMLLYWSCLKHGCESGYRIFDFGRSTPGESTFRFKQQWGASPVPLYWHYWTRKGMPVPDLSNRNPKFRLAIEAWKRLPLSLTRFLGPRIVKNIP